MKLLPKRALLAAALATAFVGVSATAIAQGMGQAPAPTTAQAQTQAATPPTAEQHAQKHAERMAHMQQKMAERQAALKAELKLTPAQEPAWNAFIARTQPQAHPAHAGGREDWSKLTTPQRLDKMQALKTERDARMQQRHDAIKSFYAALNADQQKVFDAQHGQGFQRAGMHGGKHGGHHGGGHHRMGGMI